MAASTTKGKFWEKTVMVKIGICSDVEEELVHQRKLVEKIMRELRLNARTSCFRSGEDLLCGIEEEGNMDIILLDTELGGISGVQTARLIRETDFRVLLIFVSPQDQYYRDIIMVNPFAFLDKPIEKSELKIILRRAGRILENGEEHFEFDHRKVHYRLSLSKIRYFESDRRLIYLYGADGKYSFYRKLDEVEEELRQSKIPFIRVHKSFLVNLNHIEEYRHDEVVMDDGRKIKISKSYKETVRGLLSGDLRRS